MSYAFLPVQIMFAETESVVIPTFEFVDWLCGGASNRMNYGELSVQNRPAFMAYLNVYE